MDPIATGVLVLTIGKGTKLTEMLQASTKEYIATATFGIETDTLDTEGTIIKEEPVTLTKEDVKRALKRNGRNVRTGSSHLFCYQSKR